GIRDDLVTGVQTCALPICSVLYGNNALFGVINVVTRKGRQLDGVEVSGEYGEFDTYKGRVTFGKSFTNGVELLLSGSYYNSAGEIGRALCREGDEESVGRM